MKEYTIGDERYKTKRDLYRMKLHEHIELHESLRVMRVPNGWIYSFYRLDCNTMSSTFVPYDNEFLYNEECDYEETEAYKKAHNQRGW